MERFCPGTGSVQQGLEEGKIEAWCIGQSQLLERQGVHRTAAILGARDGQGAVSRAFCTTDSKNVEGNVTRESSGC